MIDYTRRSPRRVTAIVMPESMPTPRRRVLVERGQEINLTQCANQDLADRRAMEARARLARLRG
jgi:cysteine synthase